MTRILLRASVLLFLALPSSIFAQTEDGVYQVCEHSPVCYVNKQIKDIVWSIRKQIENNERFGSDHDYEDLETAKYAVCPFWIAEGIKRDGIPKDAAKFFSIRFFSRHPKTQIHSASGKAEKEALNYDKLWYPEGGYKRQDMTSEFSESLFGAAKIIKPGKEDEEKSYCDYCHDVKKDDSFRIGFRFREAKKY